MGRPRKRRSRRSSSSFISVTDSSGAIDDSVIDDGTPPRRKESRKHRIQEKVFMEPAVRLTRSSLRSASTIPTALTEYGYSEASNQTLSPSLREISTVHEDDSYLGAPKDSPSVANSALLKEQPDPSPIGRNVRKRRQSSERLVHFDNDSTNPDDTHDSAVLLSHSATDTNDRLQSHTDHAHERSSSSDDPGSTVAKRLRPRPPEAMVRYRQLREYRRSDEYSSSGERKRHRRSKRERKARFMRRTAGDQDTVNSRSRLRNAQSTAHEKPNQEDDEEEEEEEHGDMDEEERNASDTRRYPVRNRRHTAVYQVEYAQNNHGPTRNWLAGTGYENGRRRRRHRSSHHRGLHNSGSSTSSSATDDSRSDSSAPDSPVVAATTYRRRSHTSWARAPTDANTDGPLVVDKDEVRFARRCTKSIMHARSELMPINMKRNDVASKSALNDRLLSGTSLADIEPMSIDESIGFEQVGGHESHIMALKESILLPLMYPEIFSQFGIDPPRGVLFSGPPGTGKTLLARALANECTRMTNASNTDPTRNRRPIAFFMRKGADCLSKWVGESERQLRLLFDQAFRMRPSIIFFDEIDGLAPVRSSRQDQIHSSIVSTLLSLMDGLDQRAEVVIIGATNRPDSIDPALRRPGRFDREFTFGLPSEAVRQRILEVHTAKWDPKPSPELLQQLAYATSNFSGADLKALTTEACLCCLRRQYPQVYQSRVKLALEHKYLVVNRNDWIRALQLVRPSNDRSDLDAAAAGGLPPATTALASTKRATLSPDLAPLLVTTVNRLVELFTMAFCRAASTLDQPSLLISRDSVLGSIGPSSPNPLPPVLQCSSKLLFTGDLPDCVVSAVWHRLELVQVYTLNFTNLVAFPSSVGMCPEAALAQILSAVKRSIRSQSQTLAGPLRQDDDFKAVRGCVIFIPHVDTLLHRLPHHTACYLVDRLQSLMHELAAEAIHAAFPLLGTGSAGSMDLTQTISPHACRLLLVATVRNHSPLKPPNLKGSIAELAVPSSASPASTKPPSQLADGLLSTARSNTSASVGRGQARRANENCSPLRQPNPPSPRTGFTVPPSGPVPVEKLCNGIGRPRRMSSSSGSNRNHKPDLANPGSTGATPMSDSALPNGTSSPEANSMVCSDGMAGLHEPDQSLSDEASSSESSLLSDLSSMVIRRASILSPHQKSLTVNRQSQLPPLPSLNAFHSAVSRRGRSSRLLERLFSRTSTIQLHLSPPSKADRAAYFAPVLIDWAQTIVTQDSKRHVSLNQGVLESRPPSPVPVLESPDASAGSRRHTPALTQQEIVELEREEAQLFRRLRQVLRRVVAHLARHRRFAVFARPVQVDEAPDYYEVIKHPMDLGTIRDRIDADRYRNVDDFMKDIELIYYNALEYNPANVPRSRDIRSRASEFWDEACLQLEEELHPPDLNERCKEATEAQAARAAVLQTTRSTRESSASHADKPNHGTDHTRSAGSDRIAKGLATSQLTIKSHPMPSGGRYSRRLHGQPPILETEDVQLLQNVTGRRSGSLSQSLVTNASNSDSSLLIQAKLDMVQSPAVDLDCLAVSDTMPSPIRPEPAGFDVGSPTLSEGKICLPVPGTLLPHGPFQANSSPEVTKSPTIESTRQSSSPTNTNDVDPVDKEKLIAFHQAVVNGTTGWSVYQLLRLHAEFCSVLSASRSSWTSLLTDLERVFKTCVKQNTAIEIQM